MFTIRMSRINLALDAHMCHGFTLQIASTPIVIQLLGESPLDIARTSHDALDQVAVVAVGDPKKLSKASGRCLVEALAELRRAPRDVCKNIGEALRNGVESGGFDAVRRLHVPIEARPNALKAHSKCKQTADLSCRSSKGVQLSEMIAHFALIDDLSAEPLKERPRGNELLPLGLHSQLTQLRRKTIGLFRHCLELFGENLLLRDQVSNHVEVRGLVPVRLQRFVADIKTQATELAALTIQRVARANVTCNLCAIWDEEALAKLHSGLRDAAKCITA
jgi:hypothetical protein